MMGEIIEDGRSMEPVIPVNDESRGRGAGVYSTIQYSADSQLGHLGERNLLPIAADHSHQRRHPKLDF
jgi:hypothetical protein